MVRLGQAAPPPWLVAPLATGDGLAVLLTVAGVVLTMSARLSRRRA